jgi:hypothetical protein
MQRDQSLDTSRVSQKSASRLSQKCGTYSYLDSLETEAIDPKISVDLPKKLNTNTPDAVQHPSFDLSPKIEVDALLLRSLGGRD